MLSCILDDMGLQFEGVMPKNHSKRCYRVIMVREFQHDVLADSDLCVDAIYLGGKQKNLSAEVLSKLFSVGNAGGFRVVVRSGGCYAVLFSSGEDKSGQIIWMVGFTYYGDNKTPGRDNILKKGGNTTFETGSIHSMWDIGKRPPPLFLFEKVSGRNMRYLGLAVPGSDPRTNEDSFTWKTKDNQRFQNYRAKLTILDVSNSSCLVDDQKTSDSLKHANLSMHG